MLDGSWPQSGMHSNWCSPDPRIGFLVPVLSSPLMKNGTAAAALAVRKVRRVVSVICRAPMGASASGYYTTPCGAGCQPAADCQSASEAGCEAAPGIRNYVGLLFIRSGVNALRDDL